MESQNNANIFWLFVISLLFLSMAVSSFKPDKQQYYQPKTQEVISKADSLINIMKNDASRTEK